jgi:transcriptional regulator with XRE-family HTH domain
MAFARGGRMNDEEKLKSFRLNHNLTQQQLADLLGVSQQIITYIETGKRKPSDSFKLAFLRHYKVDFDELGFETEKSIEIASNDYQVLLDNKNKEIELLKHKLDNIDRLYNVRCFECERKAVQDLSDMHFKFLEISELTDKLKEITKQ